MIIYNQVKWLAHVSTQPEPEKHRCSPALQCSLAEYLTWVITAQDVVPL